MTKENIKLFQKCTLNQAGWLISVKKLLTRLRLWNYQLLTCEIPPLESG